ncbi:MAG TPA: family 16 glycoside hydrolase [Candidatus Acidoferrales bacterium]|nr:family 16 glycoside hydrolase [Candidatus Acidoferrales bacterium]
MTRRQFASTTATAALSYRRILGANDRVRVGLLGSGGRGTYVSRYAKEFGNVDIAALADIYEPRIDSARQQLNPAAERHHDFRQVLDRKDIDAVIVASPDHWHVPMTIAAVGAGKDVYCEKPLTHSVEEGRAIIDAVRKSGRIVQVGYQQRSYPHFQQARQLIQSGRIGQVTQVLTWWNQNYMGRKPPAVDQSKLDWPQFLGSACPREFDVWRFTNWRWFWDYGNGTLTDLFSHWVDSVHWIMGDSVPSEVRGQGSKFAVDWFEAPDTVNVSWLYPKKFQVSYVSTMVTRMEDGGLLFRGTEGSLKLTRPFFEIYPESGKFDQKTNVSAVSLHVDTEREGTIDHVLNWLDCIRTRNPPNAPVESSVDAANAAHWGNEAIRSGRALELPGRAGAWKPLFNGRNLDGWVPDTPGVWNVSDGMIVGKHTGQKWNDFLRTRDHFEDFELALEFRLLNGAGNSGVQFRSIPAEQEHELFGYQADIGETYWGSLYDESRRKRVLAQAPAAAIAKLDKNGWHTYTVRALGNHITITIDGMRTVDYTEFEPGILKRGLIGLQVHAGAGIEVWFRNLQIREI